MVRGVLLSGSQRGRDGRVAEGRAARRGALPPKSFIGPASTQMEYSPVGHNQTQGTTCTSFAGVTLADYHADEAKKQRYRPRGAKRQQPQAETASNRWGLKH